MNSVYIEMPHSGGGGPWGTQLVKCLTLGLGSGCEPGVMRSSPVSASMLSAEST